MYMYMCTSHDIVCTHVYYTHMTLYAHMYMYTCMYMYMFLENGVSWV